MVDWGVFSRFTVVTLLASYAYGVPWSHSRGQQRYYNPHLRTFNYPTYNHHYTTYQRPLCTAQTPCYERMLTYTRDAIPDTSPPDPAAFIYHYNRAGFDKYAMIEEGKRAAKFFHHQYGVDVGDLPDEAYLAPNITLTGGIRFSFAIPSPATSNGLLNVASHGSDVQFINLPVSIVEWTLSFPAGSYSNGAFKGHIPAGSGGIFGSFLAEACLGESPYNSCRSTPSRKPREQIFIRFWSRNFFNGVIDCLLSHETWGEGHVIGAAVTTRADGVAHERAILTFPRSCDDSVKCFTRSLH